VSSPFWISAFLDLPATGHDETVAFWAGVTGYALSAPRGERREFATLVPPEGDDFLRVQRVQDGPGGIHLDLHVEDPRTAADEAVALGATEVADRGYVVLRSPGGLAFCFVTHPGSRRPPPSVWPDGTASLVDQVCIDVPAAAYDEECGFWSALTGWEQGPGSQPEYTALAGPPGLALRLLLQRLGEASGPARAHLDLAADDRPAEVRRHAGLGARIEAEHAFWTVLRDPAGAAYCVIDRHPGTGVPA
jgi:hypothetical protein